MTRLPLAYSDAGPADDPEPIILLHGYPLDRTMWDETAAHLVSQGRRIIRPDLRGHGLSPVVFEASTMERCADDVLGLANNLGIGRFRLGGFSLGGYVALELIRRQAERVAGLLLVDTRADPDSPEGQKKRDAAIARIRAEGMSPIADEMMPKLLSDLSRRRQPELEARVRRMITATLPQGAMNAVEGMRDRPDQRPHLGAIRVPTLIVVGAEDKLTPLDAAMVMQKAIPGAQVRIVTNAAHLTPLEAPEPFNHFLDHWVKGTIPKTLGGMRA
ncbi:MAG TPA: alpha/beta fold hydrolase [Candidatus Thermoplasmatota archaeon]|nr:alpha/beta fold hydrolase [Candidatus Thermoplasmatota archaeon]